MTPDPPEGAPKIVGRFAQARKVLRKVLAQSWLPAVLAMVYATWEFSSLPVEQRNLASLIRSWGVTFFLIMWFVGQWFRASKQISDAEQLGTIQLTIDKSLRLLQDLTETAAAESPSITQKAEPPVAGASAPPNEEPIARVLAEVPKSPKGALLILGAELEKELRQLLWSSGWIQGVGRATITRSVEHLVKLGVVPENLGGSVKAFLDVRNRMLHGYGVTEDELLRAVDIGLTILRAVLAIPREENRVYQPGVDIFEDAEGNRLRSGIKGVILESVSPGGTTKTLRVFPTTGTHFAKGQRVSWEWNMTTVVGKSWYRNPETGKLQLAWGQSAEFVGRDLDDL